METSVSLLDSLRKPADDSAWTELVRLYSPLIRNWLARAGAASSDVDDIVQEVLTVVIRRFPQFDRQPRTGAFRSWLRKIAVNCFRDHIRRAQKSPRAFGGEAMVQMAAELEDPHSGLSQKWNREHDERVMQYLLEQTRSEFSESTWRAFERFAIDGCSADETARELGITANAVFIAKSRVMSRLRKRGRGLID